MPIIGPVLRLLIKQEGNCIQEVNFILSFPSCTHQTRNFGYNLTHVLTPLIIVPPQQCQDRSRLQTARRQLHPPKKLTSSFSIMHPSGSKLWPETILKPPRQFRVPEVPSEAPKMDYYDVDSKSPMEERQPGIQSLHLPVEIVMLILTTFRDNRKTLKTCTLVCKLWLSCARYYLIPPRFAIHLTATTARDIFDIFRSPCVMLGSYIYHYSIHKQDTRLSLKYQENSSNRPVQGVDFYNCLHPFPRIFNRLRVLTLRDVGSLSSTDFKPIIPLIRAFESLTELRLRRCAFPTQDELFSILCAKRTLTRFILEEIIIRNPHPPYSSKLRLPIHLTHIGLFTMRQRYIIDWILGQKHIPPIMSLCFGGVGEPEDQRAIGHLLMALGPHLKHLKFYIPNWNNECKKILKISEFSDLRMSPSQPFSQHQIAKSIYQPLPSRRSG